MRSQRNQQPCYWWGSEQSSRTNNSNKRLWSFLSNRAGLWEKAMADIHLFWKQNLLPRAVSRRFPVRLYYFHRLPCFPCPVPSLSYSQYSGEGRWLSSRSLHWDHSVIAHTLHRGSYSVLYGLGFCIPLWGTEFKVVIEPRPSACHFEPLSIYGWCFDTQQRLV